MSKKDPKSLRLARRYAPPGSVRPCAEDYEGLIHETVLEHLEAVARLLESDEHSEGCEFGRNVPLNECTCDNSYPERVVRAYARSVARRRV